MNFRRLKIFISDIEKNDKYILDIDEHEGE
jgi:hypothetical protein